MHECVLLWAHPFKQEVYYFQKYLLNIENILNMTIVALLVTQYIVLVQLFELVYPVNKYFSGEQHSNVF